MLHLPKSCLASAPEKSLKHVIGESQRHVTDFRAQVKNLESLESHIVCAEAEVERIQTLIAKARATAAEVTSNVNALKLTCAVRLQSFIRGFLAKRKVKQQKMAKLEAKYCDYFQYGDGQGAPATS